MFQILRSPVKNIKWDNAKESKWAERRKSKKAPSEFGSET